MCKTDYGGGGGGGGKNVPKIDHVICERPLIAQISEQMSWLGIIGLQPIKTRAE